jgi:hypothetical protein
VQSNLPSLDVASCIGALTQKKFRARPIEHQLNGMLCILFELLIHEWFQERNNTLQKEHLLVHKVWQQLQEKK